MGFRLLDDPSVPQLYVKANYILVEGQLFAGTASQPYRQKAIFELTPAPGRKNLQYTFSLPAEPQYPRNLGHKVFAVVRFAFKISLCCEVNSIPFFEC